MSNVTLGDILDDIRSARCFHGCPRLDMTEPVILKSLVVDADENIHQDLGPCLCYIDKKCLLEIPVTKNGYAFPPWLQSWPRRTWYSIRKKDEFEPCIPQFSIYLQALPQDSFTDLSNLEERRKLYQSMRKTWFGKSEK